MEDGVGWLHSRLHPGRSSNGWWSRTVFGEWMVTVFPRPAQSRARSWARSAQATVRLSCAFCLLRSRATTVRTAAAVCAAACFCGILSSGLLLRNFTTVLGRSERDGSLQLGKVSCCFPWNGSNYRRHKGQQRAASVPGRRQVLFAQLLMGGGEACMAAGKLLPPARTVASFLGLLGVVHGLGRGTLGTLGLGAHGMAPCQFSSLSGWGTLSLPVLLRGYCCTAK